MTLRLVKGGRFTDEALQELLAGLREFMGQDMRIDVEFVEEIPLGVTGKRTPVVSEVALDFQHVTSAHS
jgi:phenylacetate-CoA ligase